MSSIGPLVVEIIQIWVLIKFQCDLSVLPHACNQCQKTMVLVHSNCLAKYHFLSISTTNGPIELILYSSIVLMSTPKSQNMNHNNLLSSEISSENHSDPPNFSVLDRQLTDRFHTVFSWFCLHEATLAIFPEKPRFFSLVKPILFWKFMMCVYKEKYRGGPQKSPESQKTKLHFFSSLMSPFLYGSMWSVRPHLPWSPGLKGKVLWNQ